jgi:protein CpxP
MLQPFAPPARTIAAATLFAAMTIAGPLTAAAASDAASQPALQFAQASSTTPPPSGAKATPRQHRSMADRIEERIKSLHDQLKITPDQEAQWKAVADAMREDSKAMQSIVAERRQNRASMTAVDDLQSYEKVAETHVQGLQKLIPAFQTLYASMSPDQKKNADMVFAQRRGGRRHGTAHSPRQQ